MLSCKFPGNWWRRMHSVSMSPFDVLLNCCKDMAFFNFQDGGCQLSWNSQSLKFYWLIRINKRVMMHHRAEFGAIFQLFKMVANVDNGHLPSWFSKIWKFYFLTGSAGLRYITMPNFIKISETVAEIPWFFNFSRWCLYTILDLVGIHAAVCSIESLNIKLIWLIHLPDFGFGQHFRPCAERCRMT